MDGNFSHKSSKISLKSFQNRRLGVVLGALGGSWGGLGFGLGILGRLGGLLGRLGPKKVANMAPTWLPKRVQHRPNIDTKMPAYAVFIFGSIFDRFLLPTSTPRTFKIIVFLKEKQSFFKKTPFKVGIDF